MTSQLGVCPHLFSAFFRKLTVACRLYGEGRWLFHCIGHDYTVYIDYMDLAVRKSQINLTTHPHSYLICVTTAVRPVKYGRYIPQVTSVLIMVKTSTPLRWLICASMLPWSDMMLISTVALSKTLISCVLLHNMWQLDRLHADAENLKLPLEINTCM